MAAAVGKRARVRSRRKVGAPFDDGTVRLYELRHAGSGPARRLEVESLRRTSSCRAEMAVGFQPERHLEAYDTLGGDPAIVTVERDANSEAGADEKGLEDRDVRTARVLIHVPWKFLHQGPPCARGRIVLPVSIRSTLLGFFK